MKITVVTCLYDINRDNWQNYSRSFEKYLNYFKNILSLDMNLVVYTDDVRVEKCVSFFKKPNIKIIKKQFKDLKKYKDYDSISKIMNDDSYKKDLVHGVAPEYCVPEYSILINSKIDLVCEEIERNIFGSEAFLWLDAGMKADKFLLEQKYKKFPNEKINLFDAAKFTILCRSIPQVEDLNINVFYKSHINRLAAGIMFGNGEIYKDIKTHFDAEYYNAIDKNLIDSEQSILTVVYLKNKEKFNLYYGDWYALFDNLIG
jgi:protein YibB